MRRVASMLCLAALAAASVVASVGCSGKAAVVQGTKSLGISQAPKITAGLIWTYMTKLGDEPQALFVIRLTNPGNSPVSGATVNVQALDKSGTIVGSGDLAIPTIPARGGLDYFGDLGGTVFSTLSGQPAKLTVGDVTAAQAGPGASPMLKNSELKLSKADPAQSFANTAYAYDMTVKVTNDTSQVLDTPVHQQVVLYDASGKPIGGGDGSSDNQPKPLGAGASYLEKWTGIPATHPAASARYSVWPAG
jgi:hypothetical protein